MLIDMGAAMNINPLTAIDFYKADHRRQYPEGTTQVYSNLTARSSKHAKVLRDYYDEDVVFFGLQYFIKSFLIQEWNDNFFKLDKDTVVKAYKRRLNQALGMKDFDVSHIEALHDLGYLPIRVKALPEGVHVPIGVPMLTVVNTLPEFFWLTNYLETIFSCYLWKPITSATIAFEFKKLLTRYAKKTGAPKDFVAFQAHDFSFRGAAGLSDALINGAAHLTSFVSTDTVAAIDLMEAYYHANADDGPLGVAVPATEHSVMCMDGEEHEKETIKRLVTETYPDGIVSIVADTWDYWKVITEDLLDLKPVIMARDGKVVIRPDSGDPTLIVCGDPSAPVGSPEYKGTMECLWDIFGGQINTQGYKVLDAHIGLIYGDSITLERANIILKRLESKGFASGNIVFGVGSMTYQSTIRDTFGFAMKATSGIVKDERRSIFKNPKTDSGTKKSAKGLLRVEKEGDHYVLYQNQTEEQEQQGELKTIFEDGVLKVDMTLADIRKKLL
jgi:nicotinamide phosphoribosyltransferase